MKKTAKYNLWKSSEIFQAVMKELCGYSTEQIKAGKARPHTISRTVCNGVWDCCCCCARGFVANVFFNFAKKLIPTFFCSNSLSFGVWQVTCLCETDFGILINDDSPLFKCTTEKTFNVFFLSSCWKFQQCSSRLSVLSRFFFRLFLLLYLNLMPFIIHIKLMFFSLSPFSPFPNRRRTNGWHRTTDVKSRGEGNVSNLKSDRLQL